MEVGDQIIERSLAYGPEGSDDDDEATSGLMGRTPAATATRKS